MTNSKINEQKTSKKNKVLNEKRRHTKRDLKKSTRVDEENKNRTIEFFFFFMQTVLDVLRFIWNDIKRTGL